LSELVSKLSICAQFQQVNQMKGSIRLIEREKNE